MQRGQYQSSVYLSLVDQTLFKIPKTPRDAQLRNAAVYLKRSDLYLAVILYLMSVSSLWSYLGLWQMTERGLWRCCFLSSNGKQLRSGTR